MIGIVDYGVGNLHSVCNALDYLGTEARVCADAESLDGCDRLILPGVGAFSAAMKELSARGLTEPVRCFAQSGRPFLGICLGMQMLFDESLEFGCTKGLGLIPGRVVPIDAGGLPVPHMGWNALSVRFGTDVLRPCDSGQYMYFVHSFRADCEPCYIAADAEYGERIPALIAFGNVLGAQFHPEKSGEAGLTLLKRFCRM